MAKTIKLNFDGGYWLEAGKSNIPKESGVYAVYVCKYNEAEDTVTLNKLIYIGEARNANERISNHKKWSEWRKEVPTGSKICFSFAGVTSPDRERAECALIYYHKPKCNDECKKSFPYEDTTVVSIGKHALIKSPITVRKTV